MIFMIWEMALLTSPNFSKIQRGDIGEAKKRICDV